MGVVNTILAPNMKLRSTDDADLATKDAELTYLEMDTNLIALKNAAKYLEANGFVQFPLYDAGRSYTSGDYVIFYDGTYWGTYRANASIAATQSPLVSPTLWDNIATNSKYVTDNVAGRFWVSSTFDASSGPNYPDAKRGEGFICLADGYVGGVLGTPVYQGDIIFPPFGDVISGNQATVGAQWAIISGPARLERSMMGSIAFTTTDATPRSIFTINISTNTLVIIEAKFIGRRTGGTAGSPGDCLFATAKAVYNNVEGLVSLETISGIPAINFITASQLDGSSNPLWQITFVLSGTNVSAYVQGATDNIIEWTHIKLITEL